MSTLFYKARLESDKLILLVDEGEALLNSLHSSVSICACKNRSFGTGINGTVINALLRPERYFYIANKCFIVVLKLVLYFLIPTTLVVFVSHYLLFLLKEQGFEYMIRYLVFQTHDFH